MTPAHILIVVATHNASSTITQCLDALLRFTSAPEALSLVVVDNASTDATVARVRSCLTNAAWSRWRTIEVIANQENRGAAAACHTAATSCPASWAFLLKVDHDVIVEPETLSLLVHALETSSSAGLAGPTILEGEDAECIQSQGTHVNLWTGAVHLLRRGERHDHTAQTSVLSVPAVSGCCCLIQRSALEQSGGFREEFFLSFDDTDLCYRLRHRGQKILVCPEAVAEHRGSGRNTPWETPGIYFRLRNLVWFERLHASWPQLFTFLLCLPFSLILARIRYAPHLRTTTHSLHDTLLTIRTVLRAITDGFSSPLPPLHHRAA